MRLFERIYLGYFGYVFLVALLMKQSAATFAGLILAVFGAVVLALTRLGPKHLGWDIARDWLPLVYTFAAYREMDLFTPSTRDYHFENAWIVWDRVLLGNWGLRHLIESTGPLAPGYLEFCYLLVYGTGAFSIAMFYATDRRDRIDRFLAAYACGTLVSYALFPYFPSDPPRVVFPGLDQPTVTTVFREFNLYLVGNYGIHSSVFPSAHVSSAFGAAWGLFRFLPEKPWLGRAMLIYAVSVSLATIYGRYHYAADAAAGAVVGLAALLVKRR